MPNQFASILVASEDFPEASALSLPVTLIVASSSRNDISFSDDGGLPLPIDQVMLRTIGQLPLSSSGKKRLSQLAELWRDRLDNDPPAEITLGDEILDIRTKVLEWLVARLTEHRQKSAQRSTCYMRELGLLRQQHEAIQASFQKLEQFVYRHGPQHRTLETTLSPVSGQLPITLRGDSQLIQRLPGTSAGLSDLAIHIGNETAPAEGGMLNVSLLSPDTNETLAIWEVPAARLEHGWLRFSLDRALGPDTISLMLNVSYQGKGVLKLSSAVQHPEPRFHPEVDGQPVETLPALQLWRWIAGANAPVPAHAVIQIGGRNRLRRVERDTLATAIDLETLNSTMPLFQSSEALLVHVVPRRVACGILPGIALPGARQVFATLATRHAEAPTVEYQLALLPQDQRPHKSGRLPDFDAALASGWIRLAPEEEGQAHVLLPRPLDAPHDIYLMTRLPKGQRSNAYGWSTFSHICLQF
ncbi:DUF6212 domain-containing protein [Pontibaca methylaminivorans]|uniref:Uncharacterized protein n=1 Tax=Pontibaca methylaminivorans TaxID=515897 RepID=A0A1R3X851_9RHOB|nr:DUF6212 domain-containing protein [Pontibaca methylaminivorans]SIT87119.1 hypothetical protein SAMN05421849_2576 [Pontibaca methylaminivorans]